MVTAPRIAAILPRGVAGERVGLEGRCSSAVVPSSRSLRGRARFAACVGTPSQAEAEAATCEALQTFSDEMRTLTSMDATNATVDEVKAQRSKVQSAWAKVKDAYADVDGADTAALDGGRGAARAGPSRTSRRASRSPT